MWWGEGKVKSASYVSDLATGWVVGPFPETGFIQIELEGREMVAADRDL